MTTTEQFHGVAISRDEVHRSTFYAFADGRSIAVDDELAEFLGEWRLGELVSAGAEILNIVDLVWRERDKVYDQLHAERTSLHAEYQRGWQGACDYMKGLIRQ